jgi:hypothetical protein
MGVQFPSKACAVDPPILHGRSRNLDLFEAKKYFIDFKGPNPYKLAKGDLSTMKTMKTIQSNRFVKTSLRVLFAALALTVSSAWAAFVTWDLNPDNLDETVNSPSHDFTVDGSTITAHGYDNQNGVGNDHVLFFKNSPSDSDEHGLGLFGTLHNELQVGAGGVPLHFIQLDLSSILAQGFINGRLSVGSVQPGELFNFYGSNTLGTLGILLNATPLGHEVDNQFVAIPDFGTYHFISVVAAALDVLPVAFQAELAPIPEAASLIPVALLAISAALLEIRRRRRAFAQ